MSDVLTANLVAEILTQHMPTSDAFEKAQTAVSRHGVHHGFGLFWGTGSQLTNPSTRYLFVQPGKASLAAVAQSAAAAQGNIFVAAELTVGLLIDLEGLSSPILNTDVAEYYIALVVDYTASQIDGYTGLVANPGSNDAKFQILPVATYRGWTTRKGIILGKFSRGYKMLALLADSSLAPTDMSLWPVNSDLPDVTKDQSAAVNYHLSHYATSVGYHCIGKRVRLRQLADAVAVNSSVMPLADITAVVAGSTGDIAAWDMPVPWLTGNHNSVYGDAVIWKDLASYELLDSRFVDDVQLAFHRTPGHGLLRDAIASDPTQIINESVVRGWTDYGVRTMVLDFKGTVFEKNLTIDLVLDFTGQPKDCLFRLFVKNAIVKGDMVVNYGQSILGLAGGTQGILTFEKCLVYGQFDVRPWPQVNGVAQNAAVVPAGSPAWPSWMNRVDYYANSAGNITFTGFTLGGSPDNGPDLLNTWRVSGGSSLVYTKGPVIPCYLHDAVTGAGEYAMGNPWLTEGADGGVRFIGCTLPGCAAPHFLLGAALGAVSAAIDTIRVKLVGCVYWDARPAGSGTFWNMIAKPTLRPAANSAFTIREMLTQFYKRFLTKELISDGAISGLGNFTAGGFVQAGGVVHSDTDVIADHDVLATNSVHAVVDVGADEDVNAGVNVSVGQDLFVTRFSSLGNLSIGLKNLVIDAEMDDSGWMLGALPGSLVYDKIVAVSCHVECYGGYADIVVVGPNYSNVEYAYAFYIHKNPTPVHSWNIRWNPTTGHRVNGGLGRSAHIHIWYRA